MAHVSQFELSSYGSPECCAFLRWMTALAYCEIRCRAEATQVSNCYGDSVANGRANLVGDIIDVKKSGERPRVPVTTPLGARTLPRFDFSINTKQYTSDLHILNQQRMSFRRAIDSSLSTLLEKTLINWRGSIPACTRTRRTTSRTFHSCLHKRWVLIQYPPRRSKYHTEARKSNVHRFPRAAFPLQSHIIPMVNFRLRK
jgi:hypothetical protein